MSTARKRGGGVNRVSTCRRRRPRPRRPGAPGRHPVRRNHDGGAIEFGPDGMLYVGTGDANVPYIAQDLSHPNGKVRCARAGRQGPAGQPVPGSAVWAYGFRNISGLSFHPGTGELWAASHGPSSNRRGAEVHGLGVRRAEGQEPRLALAPGRQQRRAIRVAGPLLAGRGDSAGRVDVLRRRMFPKFQGNYPMTSLRSELMHRVDVGPGNSIRTSSGGGRKTGRLGAIAHGPDGAPSTSAPPTATAGRTAAIPAPISSTGWCRTRSDVRRSSYGPRWRSLAERGADSRAVLSRWRRSDLG